jgi:hypothetical protein
VQVDQRVILAQRVEHEGADQQHTDNGRDDDLRGCDGARRAHEADVGEQGQARRLMPVKTGSCRAPG